MQIPAAEVALGVTNGLLLAEGGSKALKSVKDSLRQKH